MGNNAENNVLLYDLQDIGISFGSKTVLENINLQISTGDHIGIMGANGSGKTTLIETLLGVHKPEGKIVKNKEYLKNVKILFQEIDFDDSYSLKRLYKMYFKLAGFPIEKNIPQLFEKYELLKQMNTKYKHLSGGQKQKFKLLMSLEFHPQVLIVDEVTTALDYVWKVKVIKTIKQYITYNPDVTLIVVSHDYQELKQLTDKVFLVDDNHHLTPVPSLEEIFDVNTDSLN